VTQPNDSAALMQKADRALASARLLLSDSVWQAWYRSTECDILHDFYIPALRASVRYDRVAGYFTSTSLAVASQGFTALIKHQGHVRLVVGGDLDPEDVRAIVDQDDRKRLADSLLAELGGLDDWPETVTNGMGLLSWMVQEGYLELRVALRVHRETGEPLSFSSSVDGYAHEKWAVFRDADDNRLIVAGSINESKTALTPLSARVCVASPPGLRGVAPRSSYPSCLRCQRKIRVIDPRQHTHKFRRAVKTR